MTSDPKKPSVAFWAAVVVVVVLSIGAVYVTAYFMMVQTNRHLLDFSGPGGDPVPLEPDYSGRIPRHFDPGPRDQEFWAKFFAPIHGIDRKLRPSTWEFDRRNDLRKETRHGLLGDRGACRTGALRRELRVGPGWATVGVVVMLVG